MADGTSRLRRDGGPGYHLALVSSFVTHAVVPANGALAVPAGLEPALGCLLGCGVMTGVVSVTRRANVRPGESVAVFACGGWVSRDHGRGARLGPSDHRRRPGRVQAALALELGATQRSTRGEGPRRGGAPIRPRRSRPCLRGARRPAVAEQAFAATRTGGTTVLIGQPAMGVTRAAPGLRADPVRARRARHPCRRRDARAQDPRARGVGGRGKLDLSPSLRTGSRSRRSTRRSRPRARARRPRRPGACVIVIRDHDDSRPPGLDAIRMTV